MSGMRVVVPALGDLPDVIDTARFEPQPMPEIGPRDVVVEVKASCAGWVDLIMMAGQYQHLPEPPYTPGLEYAGVVVAVGADANVAVGMRTLVDPFQVGPRSSGPYQRYGGFATYAVAPASACLALPGALDFDGACNLLGNYETAYHCLVARGKLAAGETVLVHGASGSTGLAAVHLAKLLGATVIATGRSDERLAIVKAQGADHVINTTTADLKLAVKALGGVDVVYDGVGGNELADASLRALKFGGRYLIVGWAATPGKPTLLPANIVMMKGVDVLGCPMVISSVKNPALRPPRLAQVLAWAAEGKIRPYISHTFPLADFRAALHAKWRGEVVGGCVVRP
jgi:NADPH2:quinone reductase